MSKLRILAAATLASAVLATPSLAESRSGEQLSIWFDTGGPVGGTYNTIVQNGAKQACIDLGCDLTLLYSDWNAQKMIENMGKSVAAQPDGIVVMGHPGDDAFAPLVDEARQKGILVTSTDTELPKLQAQYASEGFGYTGVDNYQRGYTLATEALRRSGLKAGDRALVWGLKRLPTRGRSSVALIETLEKAGLTVDYLEISESVDKDASTALPLMTAQLSRHPDTKMVLVDHGALTAQMENFLRAANVGPDEIFVGGFSLSPATAAAVQNGYIDLIGDGQPYLQGYLPVLQLVLTKKLGFSGLTINTGGGFIHRDNIDLIAPLAQQGLR